jgi:hypothetical protein
MCASPLRGAAGPVGPAEYELRLSAFCFRFFLSFFRSCPFVIRAEASFANASTGICLLQPGMEHRLRSVVTVSNAAVNDLGRKDAPRERFVIASATRWSEAIQAEVPLWIASSLTLLAMTRARRGVARMRFYFPLPPQAGGGDLFRIASQTETPMRKTLPAQSRLLRRRQCVSRQGGRS